MQTRVQCFLQCIPPTYSLKRQKKLLFKYFFLEMNMRRNTAFKKNCVMYVIILALFITVCIMNACVLEA